MPNDIDEDNFLEEDAMEEYKALYYAEVKEHLSAINSSLLAYERNPSENKHIEEIFRSVHTIKGSSSMMGYEEISQLAHSIEDVFDLARHGKKISTDLIDLFFQAFDQIEIYITELEKKKHPEICFNEIIDMIQNYSTKLNENEETKTPNIKINEDNYKLNSIESIRVKTDELDQLMNLVGELVINKSQLNQVVSKIDIPEIKHNLNNVDRISTELQDIVTQIRMVPVNHIFNRFPRLVRDLSHQKKKQVRLVIEGKGIELDRKILEEISEPLIHILRNAVDHGIESPKKRSNLGKSEEGLINIKAKRNQENIIIEVSDDGAGINPETIKKKAIDENIITKSETESMTENQLINLIMINGFSTVNDVTELSGRGVGMNIVKNRIESLGGSVVIDSELGKGTKLTIKLPLSLSIIKAMLIETWGNNYAIPLNFIEEIVSVEKNYVHNLGHFEAIQLREQSLRLFHLRDLLNLSSVNKKRLHILIIKNEEDKFGLVVDSIIGMREIMTKKLSSSLQNIKGLSGVTILGDGRVILVIDPITLVNKKLIS